MSQESITALFHNQKNLSPDTNSGFNQTYAYQSPELHLDYNREQAELQFQPILEVLDRNFPSLKGKTILEIGGSTGILSRTLQDKGGIVTMLETEEPFVSKAKERGIDARLYNGSNLYSIIDNQQFEIIVANRVFEEVVMSEYQIQRLLTQTRQYLKTSGILIIGTQNPDAVRENIFNISGFRKLTVDQFPFHSYIKQVSTYNKR